MGMPTGFEESKDIGAHVNKGGKDPNIIKVETHDVNKIICVGDSMRYLKFAIGPMDWTCHEFNANQTAIDGTLKY
jgi:hypothetical protein